MAVRVGINGFGRIGRLVFRAIEERSAGRLEVVAVNDLTDAQTNAHLLKYDSNYGVYPHRIEAQDGIISIDGRQMKVLAQKDPAQIPWKEMGVEIVIESTGLFTDADKAAAHVKAGAKKVLISAPAKKEDITIILGVNDGDYDPSRHTIISNGSCTTNCIVPVVKVLHDKFTVARGLMTTIHSYTNDQRILDLYHRDLRRARAAAVNMIPTTTGAARLVGKLIPELNGKVDGMAVRVPTPVVSLVDFTCDLKQRVTVEQVNEAFREAANGSMKGLLDYCDEPLVSMDFRGSSASATFDALSTVVTDGSMVKVLAWYDNEWGYSCRLADLASFVADKGL
ncbi:MAG TPA: type I glyceraldehyde-3-phosphate dehydrogenase [Dehalococcoidia bacterium]|nr:type I glyceraldehyde-3-phosphate dehydrogenase [Dehalococcoidia bacterium]